MTHITNTNEVGPGDIDREDAEYQIKGADYTVTISYQNYFFYWKVHFNSSFFGPFLTEQDAISNAIEAGYITAEDCKH